MPVRNVRTVRRGGRNVYTNAPPAAKAQPPLRGAGRGNVRLNREGQPHGSTPALWAQSSWKRATPAVSLLARVGRGVLLTGVVLGLGALLVWGLAQVHHYVVTSDFFATQQVDVTGNVRISREMLQDLAGLHVGDNALAVSIAAVERKLLRTPWVEEVSVKRLLPGRFVIRLKERMPSFWVRQDGTLYYADSRGTVIAPVETENFLSLPTLTMDEGSEEEVEYLQAVISDLKTGRFPVEYGAVSAVHVSPGRGIEVYLEDRELRLSIASGDWQGNLRRLSLTLDDLAKRNALGAVREIRAADGNVWVINYAANP